MTKPNDCPFCDDTPELTIDDGFYYVECNCGARGPVIGDDDVSVETNKERAVDAWNRGA